MLCVSWETWYKRSLSTKQSNQMLPLQLSAHTLCSSFSSYIAEEEKTVKLQNAAKH